ncbi:autotransporter domain-containing protein [Leptolyngbya sp. 15MV]|nr:autotransporter domain-containing protein [Leptolyngbya sp. 15MV]
MFSEPAFVVQNGATASMEFLQTNSQNAADSVAMLFRNGATVNAGSVSLLGVRGIMLVQDSILDVAGAIQIGDGFNAGSQSVLHLQNADVAAASASVIAQGRLIFGGDVGASATAAGTFDVASLSIGQNARAIFNHTGDPLTINSNFSGNGLLHHIAGTTIFTGTSSSFSGETRLSGGTVRVNGNYGTTGHVMNISGNATLGGAGLVAANVTVNDGRIAPGNSAGNLTITGNLALGADSILDFELGSPDGTPGIDSDLLTVNGNLTLDGLVNVTDLGSFGEGLYRLINYSGTLTDNGLDLGSIPGGFAPDDLIIQTSVAQQVNLLVAAGAPGVFNFWDGADADGNGRIDGGSGTWSVAGTNWTTSTGAANGAYDPAQFLIFTGPTVGGPVESASLAAAVPSSMAGTVTVDSDSGAVTLANGVQFAVDGYTVTGDAIGLAAEAVTVRVGDGSDGGADFVATISAPLVGTGGLTKTDLGTLILLGANTYSGGTLVDAGTLQGDTASLQGVVGIGAQGTLVFDQAANGAFLGSLAGSGAIIKEGDGVLGIAGNSAAFAGSFALDEGGVALTGLLGSTGGADLTTSVGTTLSGTGTLGNLDLAGTLTPGGGNAAIGTLTAAGDLMIRAGSTFAVDLASSGASDRLTAGGAITLEGGTVAISLLDPELDYADGTTFVIAQATGGLTGTFAGLTETSAFLDFALSYDANRALLTLDLVRMFPDVAETVNQIQASGALMDLDRTAGSDSLAVYNALLMLDEGSARAAFDLASGEIYANVVAAEQRAALARGSAVLRRGMQPGRQGWQAWLGGTLDRVRVSGDGNGARFTHDGENFELGLEYRGEDDGWAIGALGGYLTADVTNRDRLSASDTDGWFVGGFARYGSYGRGLTIGTAVIHSDQNGIAQRGISVGSITRAATARIDTRTTALSADLRYGLGSDTLVFGPAVSVDHANGKLERFAETGAGSLTLSSDGVSDRWTRYGIGGFLAWRGTGGRILLDARYTVDDDDVAAILRMEGSPRSFTVLPARSGDDGLTLSATGSVDLGRNVTLGVDGHAMFGDGVRAGSVTAVVRWVF